MLYEVASLSLNVPPASAYPSLQLDSNTTLKNPVSVPPTDGETKTTSCREFTSRFSGILRFEVDPDQAIWPGRVHCMTGWCCFPGEAPAMMGGEPVLGGSSKLTYRQQCSSYPGKRVKLPAGQARRVMSIEFKSNSFSHFLFHFFLLWIRLPNPLFSSVKCSFFELAVSYPDRLGQCQQSGLAAPPLWKVGQPPKLSVQSRRWMLDSLSDLTWEQELHDKKSLLCFSSTPNGKKYFTPTIESRPTNFLTWAPPLCSVPLVSSTLTSRNILPSEKVNS